MTKDELQAKRAVALSELKDIEVALCLDEHYIDIIEKENAELENKIADIKANCDLAIEGRDIKIKELEKENAELKADNDARKFAMAMSEKAEKQLREQVEAMKCCENCKHYSASCCCNLPFDDCFELSAWVLRK